MRPRTLRRRLTSWLLAVLALPAGAALGAGAYAAWYHWLRGQPPPLEQTLFRGVRYRRVVRQSPRPVVAHLVRVRLGAPGLRFLVTPADAGGGHKLRAQTVSSFLRRYHLQLAVNGDFFRPFHARGLFDYYPKPGDPVDVYGMSCSRRRCYARRARGRPTLFFTCDGHASFHRPAKLCHAISGLPLLKAGRVHARLLPGRAHPRTALALDREERTLIIAVVDGRQPGYSLGLTPRELADLVREAGGYNAINLDGGGSTALVVERDGEPVQLSAPINTRLVGRERPVANHLGLWAEPAR